MSFPEFIVHPIKLAVEILNDYLNEAVPVVPPEPMNSREKHIIYVMHRSLKTKNDEIFTQIEEIRNARHEYEERMKDLDKDES